MKKIALPIILILLVTKGFSQIDIGIQISPTISMNRVSNDIEGFTLENDGSQLSFSGGLIADYYLNDNIALSSGVWYSNKKSTLKSGEATLEYSLQYVQIPISVKMFTNNITDKMRLYFQGGVTADLKITEKALNDQAKEYKKNDKFGKLFDVGLLLSTGVELNIGTSNKLYAGIIYNRGLVNVYTEDTQSNIKDAAKSDPDKEATDDEIDSSKMAFKNDLLSLVIGFKF